MGCSGSRTAWRAISAARVPPGSRTTTGSILLARMHSVSWPRRVDLPEPSGPSRTTKKPRRLIQRNDAAGGSLFHALADLLIDSIHQLLEVRARHDVGLSRGTHLQVADGALIGLSRGLIRHLAGRNRLIDLAGQGLDLIELGHRFLVFTQRCLGSPERLVFRRLSDEAAQVLRLVPDHSVTLLCASRYRSRPNRST